MREHEMRRRESAMAIGGHIQDQAAAGLILKAAVNGQRTWLCRWVQDHGASIDEGSGHKPALGNQDPIRTNLDGWRGERSLGEHDGPIACIDTVVRSDP